jgi:hypothetical protein
MSTLHPRFTTRIEGSVEIIFDLIANTPNYGRWLPGSDAFGGTTLVTPYPVRIGTKYLEGGPKGLRPGFVTTFDRPKLIAFHPTMLLKKGPLTANIDVNVRCTIEPVDSATRVTLDLHPRDTMGLPAAGSSSHGQVNETPARGGDEIRKREGRAQARPVGPGFAARASGDIGPGEPSSGRRRVSQKVAEFRERPRRAARAVNERTRGLATRITK